MDSGIATAGMFPYISKCVVFILVKDTSLGTLKLEATPEVTESLAIQEARDKSLLSATVYFLSSS